MSADVTTIKTAAETALAQEFAQARANLPGDKAVAAQREAAFDVFAKSGLPHRRVEEWKYTDLRALMRDAKPLAPLPDAAAKALGKKAGALAGDLEARRLVFVDGAFVPELSDTAKLEEGLSVGSLADALFAGDDPTVMEHLGKLAPVDDAAVALNTALMGDGAVIRVAAGSVIKRPLHLVFVSSEKPTARFARSLLVIEPRARAMLIESHEGPAGSDYQVNAALELFAGDGSHVDYVKLIAEGADALHVSTLAAAIGGKARFNAFTFTIGGSVVRNQLFLRFDGEDTVAGIRGATLIRGRQHADTTLVANHIAEGCQSREVFKAVLDDEAHSVFQGRIIVSPGAQKTDAKMMTRALLLSERAEADSKPELEIFADDVQCGHGATAGALDDELKFYLMARGIPEPEAEALLIQAFLGEAIEGIEDAGLRESLMEAVAAWLKARGAKQ
ncbi:MAG TPA: Fe-S cluster assembly protein SufD [Xanthobacteraceae bacterium]|nr:Fe-S cluster assembly protein SufD [Xanthobacteraceae bacterium]